MTVYLLRNTVNGKGYVGITRGIARLRFLAHCRLAKKQRAKARCAIHRAIVKYGPEVFTVSVLAQAATWEETTQLERAFIAELGTFGSQHGYNMTRGGDGALGRPMLETTKAKIIAANQGKVMSLSFRQAVSARFKGKPKPLAQRLKNSEAQRGVKNHAFGKRLSAEHKAKISAAGKGRVVSPETRAKISAALTGRQITEEHKQKDRAQALRRFAEPGVHPWIGRHHTDASKQKGSESLKAHYEEYGHPNAGRQLAEETKRKISESTKGRAAWNRGIPASLESVQRLRQGWKVYLETHEHPWQDRQHTEAAKAKISAANRGHVAYNRRAVIVDGVQYPSITVAGQRSGYTHMQVRYGLKQGRFSYADGPVDA
jgi:group I intron endonuclease